MQDYCYDHPEGCGLGAVKALSLDKEKVTKDLKVYKDLLKRLEMAKDMKEKFLERERRKQAERAAAKARPHPCFACYFTPAVTKFYDKPLVKLLICL